MDFDRAAIKIERVEEFGPLQRAIEEAFSAEKIERFLKSLYRARIRIRDFEAVIATVALETAMDRADFSARQLYSSLTLSDQAQMREFYLSKLETIDVPLRHKFKKLFQYY